MTIQISADSALVLYDYVARLNAEEDARSFAIKPSSGSSGTWKRRWSATCPPLSHLTITQPFTGHANGCVMRVPPFDRAVLPRCAAVALCVGDRYTRGD